jgi:hydroxymethylpyrimidine/phosphomethylpyrimidine kinase
MSTNKEVSSDNGTAAGTAIALTIAGSDSSGGAGIQADLKTFSALGVYGASVITALTAQSTRAVNGIHDAPPEFVMLQLETVLDDLAVRAIKIGMLSSVAIIEAVAVVLCKHPSIPVVLDPVMVAKSGDKLLGTDAHNALIEHLIPLATVLTPNIPEAAILLDRHDAQSFSELELQAKKLIELGCPAVLMKGGHMDGATCQDLLLTGSELLSFSHPRIQTTNTHGTGCTLSSAIAAGLAKGDELATAVSKATDYVHAAIKAADELDVGQGHGPVHHFHAMWPRK